MLSKKKIQYFYILFMVTPAIFFFINILWRIYLVRIDASLSLRITTDYFIITLLVSFGFLMIPALLMDNKLSPSNEAIGKKKIIVQDLSKLQKKGGILGIFGCIIFEIACLLGEGLLLFFGVNILINLFIAMIYVGIALVMISTILIFK